MFFPASLATIRKIFFTIVIKKFKGKGYYIKNYEGSECERYARRRNFLKEIKHAPSDFFLIAHSTKMPAERLAS